MSKLEIPPYISNLNEAQQDIVTKFREQTQDSMSKLLHDLHDSKLENPSLTVLCEMSALVGDIIFMIQSSSTEESLKLNGCQDTIDLAEVLCEIANNGIVYTVRDHIVLQAMIDSEMNQAEQATKQ